MLPVRRMWCDLDFAVCGVVASVSGVLDGVSLNGAQSVGVCGGFCESIWHWYASLCLRMVCLASPVCFAFSIYAGNMMS